MRSYAWDPARWKLPVPPKVADAMDAGQKWAVTCTRAALIDAGYPDRPLDRARTAVILGNAMAGERHYLTALRVFFPEFAHALATAPSFAALEPRLREAIAAESRAMFGEAVPPITEDTMPGELSNCIAGRIANLFDFHGPNYVVDAACASAVAALSAAIEGLVERDYDAVITGGIDRNMGPSAFVKFCKIGALSATGTRPYGDGADGFVMGEGAAVFLLKRLADAERAGDRIYAVVRGVGGSSDGKGKGLTAPNPIGQRLAVERAWLNAGLSPATVSLIEGHGTSTRVGDVVEVEALGEVLRAAGAAPRSIPLGSVKSNVGHLKAAAGAAGLLKAALALHHKVLPPSLGCARPNPNIDFERSPLVVQTALAPWPEPACGVRRAGLSAFGFGGTNFHAVLEEHVPGALTRGRVTVASAGTGGSHGDGGGGVRASEPRRPLRGALVLGAASPEALIERLAAVQRAAAGGQAPPPAPPAAADLAAAERLAIDYGDAAELADKAAKALKALRGGDPAAWRMLRQQGVFAGRGPRGKLAFLYTGQGSQYVGMLAGLRGSEPIVAETFAEADRVMTPLLGGRSLSSYIFIDTGDAAARARAEDDLKQTAITQPALLATDLALTRLLESFGVRADLVMGHSLGEYGALVAAGVLPLGDALEAVSARGREMTNLTVADPGWMAAVTAPLAEIEAVAAASDGYVVVANLNSPKQAVIGGASAAVERAMQALVARGYQCVRLPVSHAFHTQIVAPASAPLRSVLERLDVRPPRLPVVANVTGALYPAGDGARAEIIDLLARQVASPVQFIKGLETLYAEGARVFVEVGPKRALAGLADDTLGDRPGVVALSTNHPKLADAVAFNQALCGLYAAGFGAAQPAPVVTAEQPRAGRGPATPQPVVITGAALGLPGTPRVFDDGNVARILRGENLIDVVPSRQRRAMLDKRVTRVVKGEDGSGAFREIDDPDDVIRLAGRRGALDLEAEFGVSAERIAALDITTQLAIGAGLDALRDAGIPLVHHYKTTSKGTRLPDRWGLPEALRDDTGVIFTSAFPGLDAFADDLERYHRDVARREQLALLDRVLAQLGSGGDPQLRAELGYRRDELRAEQGRDGYRFDRRFLFRVLAMGHSQLAELIGARGPNTQINAACASTTQAVGLADDWIRAGRCRRVIIVAGDDASSDHLLAWVGAGFLSSGAAATDDVVERAALPFDRRRHGMILGMGAAAIVVEHPDAARERGLDPIAEVIGTVAANSAFHGTRLDIHHIAQVMERVVREAEAVTGVPRQAMAAEMVFVSHETYTPARGGSASAEIHALREVFGDAADRIVIANTKGFTGHALGVGIEDVVAIKALETGVVPPIPNYKEVDPELGALNLSHGGPYSIRYALRLGAGFGSQICMSLLRWTAPPDGAHRPAAALGYDYRVRDRAAWQAWLGRVAGGGSPQLEVVKRTLRVQDPAAAPVARDIAASVAAPRPLASPVASAHPAASPPAPAAATPAAAGAATAAAVPAAPARAASSQVAAPVRAVSAGPSVPSQPAVMPAAAMAGPGTIAAVASSGNDPVRARVLAIIAEKTGYPIDMLDDGLDLEADLGVDTVKQAETFAAVRGAYEIPRQENLKLRDFPTIAHVVQFVYSHRPDLKPAGSAAASARAVESSAPAASVHGAAAFAPTVAAPATSASASMMPVTTIAPVIAALAPAAAVDDPVRAQVLAIIAEKTGYPIDMLDDGLDLEADLGVDTVKQAETFAAVRAAYEIPRQENLKLRDFPTIAHVVQFVYAHRPDLKPTGTLASSPVAAALPAAISAARSVTAPPAAAPAITPTAMIATAASSADDPVRAQLLAIIADKTGYPIDMLDDGLDLEADLGVDTVKQAETFAAVRAAYEIPRQEDLKLRDFPTIAHVVQFVYTHRPDLKPASAIASAPVVSPVPAALSAAPSVTAPSAAAPAVTPTAMITTSASADDPVRAQVLAIIAEKTGYPIDMLDDGLDLEADLGVDTVKQAETFAAVRAAYEIPRQEDLKLRDFPTIAHVVQFVYAHRPDLAKPIAPAAPVAETVAPATEMAAPEVAVVAPASVAEFPRRVPAPVLRPPLALCKPTGVSLAAGSRVLVMRDAGGVGDALIERLAARGVETIAIDGGWSPGDILQRLAEAGAVTGVYWLAALDDEGDPARLTPAAFRDALALRVKRLAVVARALYGALGEPGAFLVAATRMGGAHGYDARGASAPLGGAVTGFVKALAREREAALCKAIDVAGDAAPEAVAEALIAETLADPGAVEIGSLHGRRIAIGLVEAPLPEIAPRFTLAADSQVVVTGAAGSIVAAITADLAARARGGTFHLLDLAPPPDGSDPDLQRFTRDREGLKRALFDRHKARGERVTPAMIERTLAGLERQAAALEAIEAIARAGGTARYHQVDLCDPAAVAAALGEVRAAGRLDLLMHAAGLEISRALPEKSDAEIARVLDVKADGWCHLIAGLGAASLGAVVVFSSIAGRFGNAGQTDYSAGNDLLCKLVSNLRRTRPEVHGVAIDWTAWAGIGMASRGSIPKVMEAAGIAMLPASVGVPAVAAELARGGGEVVVAGDLGGLLRERDSEGGLDTARAAAVAHGPMIGQLRGMGVYAPLVAETTLDPARARFLDDHRIEGTAVLPGVMGIEGFAELASLVVPGARVAAVEHMRFEAPFKFYRNEPRTLRLEAWLRPDPACDGVIADCQLIGLRRLAGRDEPQRTVHFTGRVRLAVGDHAPLLALAWPQLPADSPAVAAAEIYRTYFHGPAYQVLDGVQAGGATALGKMAEHLPPDADGGAMVLDPRRIELCFQTAGIWAIRAQGGLALPREVDELRWNGGAVDGPVVAHVRARDDGGFDAEVDDAHGVPYLVMWGYRTASLDATSPGS